jgi:hypothetical protein
LSGRPLQRGEGTHWHADKLLHDILRLRCQLTGGDHLLLVETVQPCQGCDPALAGRYVEYFEKVYKRQVCSPTLKSPEKIVVHNILDVSGSGKCKPYLEIINDLDSTIIWSKKESMNLMTHEIYDHNDYKDDDVDEFAGTFPQHFHNKIRNN